MAKRASVSKKSISVPPWFDLGKYADASRLSARQWYRLLSARQYCATMISPLFEEFPERRIEAERWLSELRRHPLSLHENLSQLVASDLESRSREERRQLEGIRSLTIQDLFRLER